MSDRACFILSCRILFALSNSRFLAAGRFFPARLMNIWIILIPDPIPFGLTFLLPMTRAIVAASLENVPAGGCVESVRTARDHRRPDLDAFFCAATRYRP